mmetsp:Transcript_13941/g.40788  ORF Transcript_13941/g.40788 Transcript_13941/m.40788 type:complete len:229 (+) Transcript_13941:1256-1942(+)
MSNQLSSSAMLAGRGRPVTLTFVCRLSILATLAQKSIFSLASTGLTTPACITSYLGKRSKSRTCRVTFWTMLPARPLFTTRMLFMEYLLVLARWKKAPKMKVTVRMTKKVLSPSPLAVMMTILALASMIPILKSIGKLQRRVSQKTQRGRRSRIRSQRSVLGRRRRGAVLKFRRKVPRKVRRKIRWRLRRKRRKTLRPRRRVRVRTTISSQPCGPKSRNKILMPLLAN